ncbi:MAG TPA: ABC transporter substrate-binding protein [Acidimicrobiales bacterium]|nr:ABC transporter substrate-binding protein [Acidimicrobiales bacterium]
MTRIQADLPPAGRTLRHRLSLLAASAGILALGTTICVPAISASATPKVAGLSHIGGSLTVWAEWSGAPEQGDFEAALAPFEAETGVKINYRGEGSNMDSVLAAAVSGGHPPDVAFSPSPATLQSLAQAGKLQPISSIIGSESMDYGSAWNSLASYGGKLYGVWYKAANKNTIWYNPAEFAVAGIKAPPTTWEGLVADAATLKAAGVVPFSFCSDIGWPVADFWQNVYLKTAGAADYNKLAAHDIAWTDPTVTKAFDTLADIVGKPQYLLGGTSGALSESAKYPSCVDQVFPKAGSMPKAAMVVEADFVVSEIVGNSSNYTAGTVGAGGKACTANPADTPCYDFFAFPAPAADKANQNALQGSGDVAMLFHGTPQAKAFMKYIASPEPAEIWAHLGGYASPNKDVPLSSYPDPVTQADAQEITHATSFVFSLDDLQGTWEPALWQDMLNFVKNPTSSNISSIEATMQKQATAALGH